MIGSRSTSVFGVLASLAMVLGGPAPASAQTGESLVVRGPDDSSLSLPVGRSRGYATVDHGVLRQLGWAIDLDPPQLRAQLGPEGPVVEFSLGSPLFRWDGELLQLVSPPFSGAGSFQIPLQFVIDFLPARASEAYAFSPDERALEILDASLWPQGDVEALQDVETRQQDVETLQVEPVPSGVTVLSARTPRQDLDEPEDLQKRVVVIDPGHGGGDPGTTGSGGRREKDIALAIGRYLERELRGNQSHPAGGS